MTTPAEDRDMYVQSIRWTRDASFDDVVRDDELNNILETADQEGYRLHGLAPIVTGDRVELLILLERQAEGA